MLLDSEIKLDYGDVLLRPRYSRINSRKEVSLTREFSFKHANPAKLTVLPVVASNMDGVGTCQMAQTLSRYQMLTSLSKHLSIDELIAHFKTDNEYSIYSLGITEEDLAKFQTVNKAIKIRWVCIDVANGYCSNLLKFVSRFRSDFPDKIIIAGNVVTGPMTRKLIKHGVDIVKVGIGPGSVCTTRIVTGVGVPQLSAVVECSKAAHRLGKYVIADGGCASPGDIAKGFAAGADFVMLGGLLAGTDEGGGQIIQQKAATNLLDDSGKPIHEIKKYVRFYGSSSTIANNLHNGGLKDYRTSEGREVLVKYQGSVGNIIQAIMGGLRSSCTYLGAKTLKDLARKAVFVRCHNTHNTVLENKN